MSMHASFHVDRTERLAGVLDQLRASETLTVDLLASVAEMVCGRSSAPDRSTSARIKTLVAAGAPLDAALALIASELPQWKLRRLTYDEGLWHCALSRQRELPEWLDQAIETSHPDCAAAILTAVVEAARQSEPVENAHTHWVPRIAARREDLVCCDNFM
ncbi:hypothetical protein [Bradyrhizobium prioriisuperbiae]|uniref:hypothetical protein n=1 Tax=Bradyrhizobium prioriisuperbiae TaxID=2854389 RepID=UPI0028E3E8E3|nr:hypothetical protein [Bradyrhizobium prioritasuperba]